MRVVTPDDELLDEELDAELAVRPFETGFRTAAVSLGALDAALEATEAALEGELEAALLDALGVSGAIAAGRLPRMRVAGGAGSGNFGHEGRPGEVGGSGTGGKQIVGWTENPWSYVKYRDAPDLTRDIVDMRTVKTIREELRSKGRLNDDNTVSLYHATLSDPESILREGLIPARERAAGQDWEATHSKYATYFHLTKDAAEQDLQYGGEIIEARIPVTSKNLIRFVPDEETDPDVHGGVKALLGGGAVAFIGGVPPSALRHYASADESGTIKHLTVAPQPGDQQ